VTDLDRLHAVLEGKLVGRGVGKTYARCHVLAGLIEVGHREVVVVLSHRNDLSYVLPMLERVFAEHGLGVERVKMDGPSMEVGGARVRFLFCQDLQWEEKLRGLVGGIVYMRHWD